MTLPQWARPRWRDPLKGLPLGYVARYQRHHLLAIEHQGEMLLLAAPIIKGRGLACAAPQFAVYHPTVKLGGRHYIRVTDVDGWLATSTRRSGTFEKWLCETFIPDAMQAIRQAKKRSKTPA